MDNNKNISFTSFPPIETTTWMHKIQEDLRRANIEKPLDWHPLDGFDIAPFYRAEDVEALAPMELPPFVEAPATARAAWHIRQDIADTTVFRANERARHALHQGASALGFVLDSGTGYGIPIRTQQDLIHLFDGIPLDKTPVHIAAGPLAPLVLALWLNVAEMQGVNPAMLQGSLDLDPIGHWVRRGRMHVTAALKQTAKAMHYASALASGLRLLVVDVHPYHDAGATTTQELALALATASEYLAYFTDHGSSVPQVCQHLHVALPIGTSFFMELAKLRALRILFAQMASAFAPEHTVPTRLYIQAFTSQWSNTVFSPYVNLLRGSTGAAAAILGGCDTLTVRPFDAPLGQNTDQAQDLGRNTQLILKYEAFLDRVVDPGAGAYYVEKLTDSLARAAWSLFQEIETRGGLIETLRTGWVQQQIAEVRDRKDEQIATGKRGVVGANQYPDLTETGLNTIQPGKQPADPVSAWPTTKIPFPLMQERFRKGASLGSLQANIEDTGLLTILPLTPYRGALPFEEVRLRTERYAQTHGRTPAVFLLPIGHPALRNARATFIRNFFGCAGFTIHESSGFDTPETGVAESLNRGAELIVVCSADAEYATYVPAIVEGLRTQGAPAILLVAGYPKAQIEILHQAGVDGFIHVGSPILETLRHYQNILGI